MHNILYGADEGIGPYKVQQEINRITQNWKRGPMFPSALVFVLFQSFLATRRSADL